MDRLRIDRRRALGLAAAAGVGLTLRPARAATGELVWATWESNGKPAYVEAFTKQTGTRIRQSYLSSEDAQFAAMKAGSSGDWDVVNPSLNGSWRYIKAGVLQKLDLARLPGTALLYDAFKATPKVRDANGQVYAIPYLWGLNPIVYRTDKFDHEPDYGTLFDARYKGQLAMRDYALESIAIAGLYVGVPREHVFTMSDAELAEAKRALVAQKPLLRTYWQTIGDLTNLFATSEVSCAFSWRVPFDALNGKLPMGMAKPKAGIMGWCDCFGIPASLAAEKLDAAYAFGNYLLGPDYAWSVAMDGNYASASSVVRDKLPHDKQAAIFVDDLDVMKGFMWAVAPPNYSQWIKLWNEVKAA